MIQTILIGIVAFIGFLECGLGNSMIQRPIVMGPLVGLVLGDLNRFSCWRNFRACIYGKCNNWSSFAARNYRRWYFRNSIGN